MLGSVCLEHARPLDTIVLLSWSLQSAPVSHCHPPLCFCPPLTSRCLLFSHAFSLCPLESKFHDRQTFRHLSLIPRNSYHLLSLEETPSLSHTPQTWGPEGCIPGPVPPADHHSHTLVRQRLLGLPLADCHPLLHLIAATLPAGHLFYLRLRCMEKGLLFTPCSSIIPVT